MIKLTGRDHLNDGEKDGEAMARADKEKRSKKAIEKEWRALAKKEERMTGAYRKEASPAGWRQTLEAKVPDKIRISLEKAFCLAFSTVFEKGIGIIEKSYDREKILGNLQIHDYAFQVKGDRKTLKKVRSSASLFNLGSIAATTVEGIGLGALGIGLPDIVIFTGMLLRGIYETALHYGFDYNSPKERYFILKLMEASIQKGEAWCELDKEIDAMFMEEGAAAVMQEKVREQIERTSDAFAADMLALKFIQGLPVVGILGGCGNPVYYHKVMKYARLKYYKRYLWGYYRENGAHGNL